ncbi:MAG: DUF885 family protein [Lachnospiraceae bacterium]|nr:DUF885 family protein [Lachnospiraceae bacterium]
MYKRGIWKRILCLLLVIVLVTACGAERAQKREGGKEPNNESTPTPTAGLTATPEPTAEPTPDPTATPTPTEAATPTPTPVSATPTPTPRGSFDSVEEERAAFDEYLTEIFVDMVGTDSISLHFVLEHPEEYGITPTYDYTEEPVDYEEAYLQMKEYADGLFEFNYENLTEPQKINYDRLMYQLSLCERYRDIKPAYNYLMEESGNSVNGISTMLMEYPLIEEKDLESYVKELYAVAEYFPKLFASMKSLCMAGLCPTQGMYDTTVENTKGLCKKDDNVLLIAFVANMKQGGFSNDIIDKYTELAKTAMEQAFIPAAEQMLADVRTLEIYVSDPVSLGSRDGGKKYYEFLVESTTGSGWSVDRLYSYLLYRGEKMLTDYTAIRNSDRTVMSRKAKLEYGSRDFDVILNDLKKRTANEYPKIRDTKFIADALPEELRVEGILAYFLEPQYDNPDHKVIRVNPDNDQDSVELFSTLAHEGYPGHLYQNEYFRSSEGYHPINTQFHYTGYLEGWATMMGKNAYLWAADGDENVAFIFDLDYTFSMAMVACCDIGVNYYNWSKDELRKFMSENMLNEKYANEIYASVVADPGTSLSYSLCHFLCLDIIDELMQKGMTQKEAYEAFLKVGPSSFSVLRKHLGLSAE